MSDTASKAIEHTPSNLSSIQSKNPSFRKNKLHVALGICACLMGGEAFAQSSSQLDARLIELEKEIKELKTEIATQEKKGVVIKKGTRFQYGGFIKADFIASDFSDGDRALASVGDDLLVPSVIPVGNDDAPDDITFDSHVKHSRFWFKTTTDVGQGTVTSYIETDFNSGVDERITNQASNGLRHAFLSWKYNESDSLLVGQTWSTFFNVAALPETIDFVGPSAGSLFTRQPQIRWTKGLGNGSSFMLAAENPSSSLYDGGVGFGSNQFDSNTLPDLVARYNGKAGNFNYSLAVVGREIAYSSGGIEEDEYGAAVNFTGIYKFDGGDNIRISLSQGTLGRYIALAGFRDGAIEADGDIDLIDTTGGFISYQHFWNKKLRSTFTYAISTADNPDSVGGSVNETLTNANASLLYSPVPKLTFGVGYIYAERELEDGTDGDLNRLQFTSKWVF
ncbi:DcaP family trimeric outer membrane transporter [Sessilibacter corallicola]|uniref:DcaP family trimeric outer membrane transporter n=1 Tax=Sessilibacter corallicola TaxID=2904075 RepID=A0ABQ0AEC1_9GAMM